MGVERTTTFPPAQHNCGDEHQREPKGRRRGIGVHEDHTDAGDREQQRRNLKPLNAFAGEIGGKPDREEGLHLNDERGETRSDVPADGDEHEPELPGADEQAIGGKLAPRHRRPRQQEHRRQQCQREPQGGEQERGQVIEPEADDDEVRSPDRHHGKREQPVA